MRIFLIETQPVFREGLKRIIATSPDLKIVGELSTSRNLTAAQRNVDLLILDGELDSLDLLQSIRRERPRGRPPFALVIAEKLGNRSTAQILRAGADGYVEKCTSIRTVLEAIRTVGRGGRYLDPQLAEKLVFLPDQRSRKASFSIREYQVLHMIGSGFAMKEIAARLFLSVKTVSSHRYRILVKLNLKNTADLVRYALNEGVVV